MKPELQCTIIDESSEYSLRELCNVCKVHAQFIQDLIDEGILSPQGQSPQEWRFAAIEIKRIQVSIRLQQDLRINLPGTALALDLLDEITQLKRSKSYLDQFYALDNDR